MEVPSAFTTALNPKPPSGAEKQEIEANAVAAAKRGGQRPHVIVVSSMPLHLLVSPTTHFIRSALALAIPAFVLYDADPSIPLSGIPEGVQAEELFGAIPALAVMMEADGPIARAYAYLGFVEMFNNLTGMK